MVKSTISKETKNLLKNLLHKNYLKRFDIDQVLSHSAFDKI